MKIWGYRRVEEIIWVKTNQLQRIVRTGRTGHWLNHAKEHCIVGIKGNPKVNRNIDCDVIISEVRETSRKPDEIYNLIERMSPGGLKVEIFGRPHNTHTNWVTLGNQLDGTRICHEELLNRYNNSEYRTSQNRDFATLADKTDFSVTRPDEAPDPTGYVNKSELKRTLALENQAAHNSYNKPQGGSG